MSKALYIGLISGTSMDAVDCALVEIDNGQAPRLLDFLNQAIPAPLKQKLLDLCEGEPVPLRLLGEADVELGALFAEAVVTILERNKLSAADVTAIGSHGQTVWHQPPRPGGRGTPFTLQIGDPNTIAQRTGITTVADFRRRDMAAGGEGAPLLPALHRHVFQSKDINRIILNLGGIANITVLNSQADNYIGFDVGPANALMDTWIEQHTGDSFDNNGAWAASGKADASLLNLLLEDDFFSAPPPKSTGREYFNAQWLDLKLANLEDDLAPADVQATLLELTATTVANAVLGQMSKGELIVCGGGARNQQLLARLQERLPGFKVKTSTSVGLDCDCVEAIGFAWFASQTLAGVAMDFTGITGSSHPVILGGIYPAS